MNVIPFEKVSIQEARAALEGDRAQEPEQSWAQLRKASDSDKELTAQTRHWLGQLPDEVHPEGVVHRFPRIANKLAELWTRPLQCEEYMDALLMDLRGSRKGFSPDVAKEISVLKTHYITNIMVQHFGAWGERIGW